MKNSKLLFATKKGIVFPLITLAILIVVQLIEGTYQIITKDYLYIFGGDLGNKARLYFEFILFTSIVVGARTNSSIRNYMQFSSSKKHALLLTAFQHFVYYVSSFVIFIIIYFIFETKVFTLTPSLILSLLAWNFAAFSIGLFFSGLFTVLGGWKAGLSIPLFAIIFFWINSQLRRPYVFMYYLNVNIGNSSNNFHELIPLTSRFIIFGITLTILAILFYSIKPSKIKG